MAREYGFSVTIKAWIPVDRRNPALMINAGIMAAGEALVSEMQAEGWHDVSVTSNFTSRNAVTLEVPRAKMTIEGPAPAVPEAPLLDPLEIPADLDRRQKP